MELERIQYSYILRRDWIGNDGLKNEEEKENKAQMRAGSRMYRSLNRKGRKRISFIQDPTGLADGEHREIRRLAYIRSDHYFPNFPNQRSGVNL